jgi:hypothetical protein
VGPAIAGLLATRQPTLLIDAGTFVVSAFAMRLVRRHRAPTVRSETGRDIDGLRYLVHEPTLRVASRSRASCYHTAPLTAALFFLSVTGASSDVVGLLLALQRGVPGGCAGGAG